MNRVTYCIGLVKTYSDKYKPLLFRKIDGIVVEAIPLHNELFDEYYTKKLNKLIEICRVKAKDIVYPTFARIETDSKAESLYAMAVGLIELNSEDEFNDPKEKAKSSIELVIPENVNGDILITIKDGIIHGIEWV